MLPKGVQPESAPARTGISAQQQAAVTAFQQQSAAVAAQAHQAQLAANTAAMMNQYLYARPSTTTTPVATPALSRAITPQQQQPTLVQMMQAQQQQQAYATPTTTPRATAAAAATPTSSAKAPAATPSPNPPAAGADPTAELKRRIAQLEKSLEEQRILSSEWKMLFEKGQVTNQAHLRDLTRLKADNAALMTKLDALQQQMSDTDKKDTIPLASAASLKRRRAAAGDAAETTNTDDDENSAKKTKTKR